MKYRCVDYKRIDKRTISVFIEILDGDFSGWIIEVKYKLSWAGRMSTSFVVKLTPDNVTEKDISSKETELKDLISKILFDIIDSND